MTRHLDWRRRILRMAGWLVLAVSVVAFLLLMTGVVYQRVSVWKDSRDWPAPGRLITVDGHALHLNCSGVGPVTVVFESAHGGTWMDWALVQPAVAKYARVCSYDRAGVGWSEPGPPPRDSERIAGELYALLREAGERPPYLLVGHSVGGFHTRVFAGSHPGEVAGMVLVDTSHSQMLSRLPPEVVGQLDDFARLLRRWRLEMYVGLPRLEGQCGQPFAGLERLAGAAVYNQCRVSYVVTLQQELAALSTDAMQAAAARLPRDLPLVVVSRDYSEPDAELPREVAVRAQVVGMEMQRELAALSSRGRLVTAGGSGHYVQIDRPDVVIDAIREVLGTRP